MYKVNYIYIYIYATTTLTGPRQLYYCRRPVLSVLKLNLIAHNLSLERLQGHHNI